MVVTGIINIYKHSLDYKRIHEDKEMILYSSVAFLFPFFLQTQQLLLGSAVNTTLVLSAFYLKGRKVLPLMVLPSIGAVANGILFGPLTVYLVYMVPFIWVGNALLIGMMKLLYVKLGTNYIISATASVCSKVGFLFVSSYLLFTLGAVPEFFLYAMGIMQAATAIAGCTSAYFVDVGRKRLLEK